MRLRTGRCTKATEKGEKLPDSRGWHPGLALEGHGKAETLRGPQEFLEDGMTFQEESHDIFR
jgi:hypothetical protein